MLPKLEKPLPGVCLMHLFDALVRYREPLACSDYVKEHAWISKYAMLCDVVETILLL